MSIKQLSFMLLLLATNLLVSINLFAQSPHPVSWTFFSQQVGPGLYEVHTIATVKEGWRFHNQTSVDVAPLIGKQLFFKNDNVLLVRNLQSSRTMAEPADKASPADTSRSYESNIHLVHLVQLKQSFPTNLSGEIAYTIHNDQQRALIQDKINFTILLR